jgi:HK97 gp10 family phage protein
MAENIKWYGQKVFTLATQANVEAMNKAALMVERDVKKSFTREGSGRLYKRGRKVHIASAPGEPPAIDTGALRASIQNKVSVKGINVIGEVGSDIPYSLYLEVGTTKMARRPYLMSTVRKDKTKIVNIFKRANS